MNKLVKGLILAGAMVAGGSAMAATQGTLGGTSQGDIDIDVSVGDEIQITGLQDITGSHVPGNNFTGTSTACVYTNNPTGNYNVTMTSSNPGTANEFRLNGPSGFIAYTVVYDDGDSTAPMVSSVANTTFDNADTSALDCGLSPQSSINITVPAASLDAAGPGTYSDVVTILVAPR